MKMSIEEKMAYIHRALELGASVDISFHCFDKKEEAKKVASEFSELAKIPYLELSNTGTYWFKIRNRENNLDTAIFYDDENFMEEDIWGTEEDEHVS